MDIKPSPGFREALLKRIEEREFKERVGTHVTDLLYCLNKQALRRLHPTPVSDNDLLLFSLGWATQRWLTGQDKDIPEQEQDGIIVTLDALTVDGLPWELKATYTSSARPIEEQAPWLRQIMAQCYVTGCEAAYLSRLEIMGNWKFGKKDEKDLPENRKPTLSAYKLEFTPYELCRNWEWLLDRKGRFEAILKSGMLLPKAVAIPSGQTWECSRCSYQGELCQQ